jgi:hypothetical protein
LEHRKERNPGERELDVEPLGDIIASHLQQTISVNLRKWSRLARQDSRWAAHSLSPGFRGQPFQGRPPRRNYPVDPSYLHKHELIPVRN